MRFGGGLEFEALAEEAQGATKIRLKTEHKHTNARVAQAQTHAGRGRVRHVLLARAFK